MFKKLKNLFVLIVFALSIIFQNLKVNVYAIDVKLINAAIEAHFKAKRSNLPQDYLDAVEAYSELSSAFRQEGNSTSAALYFICAVKEYKQYAKLCGPTDDNKTTLKSIVIILEQMAHNWQRIEEHVCAAEALKCASSIRDMLGNS